MITFEQNTVFVSKKEQKGAHSSAVTGLSSLNGANDPGERLLIEEHELDCSFADRFTQRLRTEYVLWGRAVRN